MNDEPRKPSSSGPADDRGGEPGPDADRDGEVAALLAVAPLDETTRRRLVRTASEAADEPPAAGTAPRSIGRMGAAVGVAAALLVGAVVGAVVVTRPSDPATPTAAKAPSTAPTTAAAEVVAPEPRSAEDQASTEATTGAPPQQLGDLGTVRGIAGLREALSGRFEAGGDTDRAAASGLPCLQYDAGLLGLVVVTANAEAQLDGLPVVVLVGPSPTGEDLAIVLDPARGCEILQRVTL
jgi:hypothetical protein